MFSHSLDTIFSFAMSFPLSSIFFFFNDTATTEIYTLSLHDALPISLEPRHRVRHDVQRLGRHPGGAVPGRSEEHTSELQSHHDLVCRLLLEKKKKKNNNKIRKEKKNEISRH